MLVSNASCSKSQSKAYFFVEPVLLKGRVELPVDQDGSSTSVSLSFSLITKVWQSLRRWLLSPPLHLPRAELAADQHGPWASSSHSHYRSLTFTWAVTVLTSPHLPRAEVLAGSRSVAGRQRCIWMTEPYAAPVITKVVVCQRNLEWLFALVSSIHV